MNEICFVKSCVFTSAYFFFSLPQKLIKNTRENMKKKKKNTDTMFIYYLFKKFKHFTYTKFLLIQTNSIRNNINRIKFTL